MALAVTGLGMYEDIRIIQADGSFTRQITTYGYNVDPILSPDRQRVAYRSVPSSITSLADPGSRLYAGLYNIWVITVDGRQAWKLTDSEQPRSVPDWSPDSRKVLFSEGVDGSLIEMEVDTQARREVASGVSGYAPHYRPDGNGIAFSTVGGGLAWLESDGTFHTLVPTATLPMSTTVTDFTWLPDSQDIVYVLLDQSDTSFLPWSVKSSVWMVKVSDAVSRQLSRPIANIRLFNLHSSPDGSSVVVKSHSYGDACVAGVSAGFILLTPDRQSAELAWADGFKNRPEGESFYPVSNIEWISDHLALAQFAVTCPVTARGGEGMYLVDPLARSVTQVTRMER